MARKGRTDRGLMQRKDAQGKLVWHVRLWHNGRERRFGSFPTKTKAREFYEKAKLEQKEGRFFPERYQRGGYETVATMIDRYLETAKTKKAYKGYVGQKMGDLVYKGFKPDKVNKSGYFELYSELLKIKKHPPLPTYVAIPEHEKMKDDELVLTTYKVPVHIHSRSANCKWLTEMYHDNPANINTETAKRLGIHNGDKIKVKSEVGEITTTAKVTEAIVPGVVAISHHLGHWQYGRYASGKKAPLAGDDDPGLNEKWWDTYGVHPNWIIPNRPDPINGQQRWMDTVVKVVKA
jgi:thiosulfate reductase/polysulfide reductase chain A